MITDTDRSGTGWSGDNGHALAHLVSTVGDDALALLKPLFDELPRTVDPAAPDLPPLGRTVRADDPDVGSLDVLQDGRHGNGQPCGPFCGRETHRHRTVGTQVPVRIRQADVDRRGVRSPVRHILDVFDDALAFIGASVRHDDLDDGIAAQVLKVAVKHPKVVAVRERNINIERKAEEVVRLDIPEPAELEKALTLIEKGSSAAAVPMLNKIANEYHRLHWDKIALRHLVTAYLADNNPQRAFDTCKAVMSGDSTAAYTGELAPAFWQVLLKLDKRPLFNQLIDKAVTNGDRPSSAAALVLRGDLIMEAAKDNKTEIRRALTNGYLRVILLYRDEPCREIRREALLKGANCHEKLGRPDLAENFRKQAKALMTNAEPSVK